MKKEIKKEFIYKDIDYLLAPSGWLEAKLDNRLEEGYEIWRDDKNMAWCGRLKTNQRNLIRRKE